MNPETRRDFVAAFERTGRRDAAVEGELRDARDLAADRLAQTIAALESIRLDLLRLQMGSVGVESVTASLAAAQRVGTQIACSRTRRRSLHSLRSLGMTGLRGCGAAGQRTRGMTVTM